MSLDLLTSLNHIKIHCLNALLPLSIKMLLQAAHICKLTIVPLYWLEYQRGRGSREEVVSSWETIIRSIRTYYSNLAVTMLSSNFQTVYVYDSTRIVQLRFSSCHFVIP